MIKLDLKDQINVKNVQQENTVLLVKSPVIVMMGIIATQEQTQLLILQSYVLLDSIVNKQRVFTQQDVLITTFD